MSVKPVSLYVGQEDTPLPLTYLPTYVQSVYMPPPSLTSGGHIRSLCLVESVYVEPPSPSGGYA